MQKVHLLHGTETGTAEMLAEDVQAEISSQVDCAIGSLEDIAPKDMAADTTYILFCSTFGSGDLPATAEPFFDSLVNDKPDLNNVTFAIFGLGDRTYGDTFAMGSERLMTEMIACKAKMIGERQIFDAASADMPEDVAMPWVKDILSKLETA